MTRQIKPAIYVSEARRSLLESRSQSLLLNPESRAPKESDAQKENIVRSFFFFFSEKELVFLLQEISI